MSSPTRPVRADALVNEVQALRITATGDHWSKRETINHALCMLRRELAASQPREGNPMMRNRRLPPLPLAALDLGGVEARMWYKLRVRYWNGRIEVEVNDGEHTATFARGTSGQRVNWIHVDVIHTDADRGGAREENRIQADNSIVRGWQVNPPGERSPRRPRGVKGMRR